MEKGQISFEFIVAMMIVVMLFSFGVFIFQNRNDLNNITELNIGSKDVANKFSRNINMVYLMDSNALIKDTIYWDKDTLKSVDYLNRTITVFYLEGSFYDVKIPIDVNWQITDVNGEIFFRKTNDGVSVTYE